MIVATEEVEQFYRVWFPLLHFVNRQLHLVDSFPASGHGAGVAPAKALKLREALWANDSLRENFIAQNPAGLAPDDLALVESWKYRLEGSFTVYRTLKKYAIFLSDEYPARAYGVLGILDPIEGAFSGVLPVYVQTVLLPFGHRIIHDSLITAYPVMFGPGVRADLDDSYLLAQEREGIITSLQPGSEQKPYVQHKKVLAAFQRELGGAGLSLKMIAQHVNNIGIIAQSGRFNDSPSHSLLDLDQSDVDAYLGRPDANPVSLKRFVTFLRDTGRIDYGKAQGMLDSLKSRRKEG